MRARQWSAVWRRVVLHEFDVNRKHSLCLTVCPLASGGVHPRRRHAKHDPHRSDSAAAEPTELVRLHRLCGQGQLCGADARGLWRRRVYALLSGGAWVCGVDRRSMQHEASCAFCDDLMILSTLPECIVSMKSNASENVRVPPCACVVGSVRCCRQNEGFGTLTVCDNVHGWLRWCAGRRVADGHLRRVDQGATAE